MQFFRLFCSLNPISMEHQNQADLLQDIQEENYVDPVKRDVRFVNFIIDRIAVIVIIYGGESIFKILASSMSQSFAKYLADKDFLVVYLLESMLSLICIILYYTLFEASTKGRTLGKLLTGTVAITQDGSPFTFKHALLRTLCRLIPFEPLSAFGYMPWHDRITKTTVVKKTW
jgi:uncharacterized RDD family membrane protein YckC